MTGYPELVPVVLKNPDFGMLITPAGLKAAPPFFQPFRYAGRLLINLTHLSLLTGVSFVASRYSRRRIGIDSLEANLQSIETDLFSRAEIGSGPWRRTFSRAGSADAAIVFGRTK
jgi:hypothetical protein